MNSLLFREQGKQFQVVPFSNFQASINSSSSSLNTSHHSNKSDNDYWINYYTEQKNKEKVELKTIKELKYIKSEKKLSVGSPNGKRQLVFSRPYKSQESNMKLKHKSENFSKNELLIKSVSQKNDEFIEMKQEIIPQLDDNQQKDINPNQQQELESMLSPPLSQTNLQSMQFKQHQEEFIRQKQFEQFQQIQQQNHYKNKQIMNQQQTSLTSSQVSPIQSVSSLIYKPNQPKFKLRTSESLGISSQGNIQNNNNSLQSLQQFNILQSFKSVGDINTRKNSIFKDDSSQNVNSDLNNFQEMQCIHINRLKGIGERQQLETTKNLFSNNQILLANLPNNSSYGQQLHQQFPQNPNSQKPMQQMSPPLNQTNLNGQGTQRTLDKSIMNFQKQKQISSIKYNQFLLGLNQSNVKSSVHQSHELIKQQDNGFNKLRTDSVICNSRGSNNIPILKQEPNDLTQQTNYQDSFLELSKDPTHKLFLLEGYSQQNLLLKQSLLPKSTADQQQQLIQKGKQLSQASFFHELNKQRILSGSQNISQTPTNSNSNNNNNSITSKQINGNNLGKKRLVSANQYNRKLFSNYMQQESIIPSRVETINTQQDEPNTTISNNNQQNIKPKMQPNTKIQSFNVLEGIQFLNNKQNSGSQSTTSSSTTNNFTSKSIKIPVSSTPKTQKSFQVLYKICNKNILNAGLKESKPTFYQINLN